MADGSVVIDILGDDGPIKKTLDTLGGVATTAVKGISVAVGAASTAIGVLAKNALDSYANYEQLVGGVETLFGAGGMSLEEYAASVGQTVAEASGEYDKLMAAQQATLDNAAKAYQTAGMSANEYMETVTSFSAALISSLDGDTVKASQVADKAIVDMADNANKMGSSMESIQNAYQGFAKQNYTMLDNLKLGYGGTKEEMQRLLSDAEKISGQKFDLSSYADVVEAIHVVQEEMGIAGTTSKEAASTIQGSLSSMSAAWANLVTGIADENADLPGLIDQFVTSAETAAANILPRLEQILSGVGQLVTTMAPILAEHLPTLVEAVLPSLISAGGQMVVGLVTGLVSALPSLVDAVVQAVPVIVDGLSAAAPGLLEAGKTLLSMVGDGIMGALPLLAEYGPKAVEDFAGAITENLPTILDKGMELLREFASGIESAFPDMIAKLPGIIDGFLNFISENLSTILDKGVELLNWFVDGITGAIPDLVAALPQIVTSFINFFAENFPKFINAGIDIIVNLVEGLLGAIPEIVANLPQIVDAILTGIGAAVDSMFSVGQDVVKGLWNGISDMAGWVAEKIRGFGEGVLSSLKNFFGIASPSKVMRDQVGVYLAEGVAEGIGAGAYAAEHAAIDLGNAILDTLDGVNQSLEDNQAEAAARRAQVEQDEYEAKLKEQYDEIEKLHQDTAKKIADIRAKGAKDAAQKVQDAEESAAEKEQTILDKIADLRADWEEKQLQAQEKAAQEATKAQIDALEDLKDEYTDALEDIQKSRDSMAGSLGDVDLFSEKEDKLTGKTRFVLSDLQESIDQIHAYGDAIAQLKERGVSSSLLDEILGMDREDATKYTQELLKMSDEQYGKYMDLWEEKESAAQEVASSIYAEQFAALKEEYLDVLPAEMRPAGEEAMASLNAGLEAGGQVAIQKAADIASAIADQFAGLDLGGVLAGLWPRAAASMAQFSTGLETASNAPAEAKRATAANQTAQAAGAFAAASQNGAGGEVVLQVNGIEFARGIMPDWRAVEDQSPRIVSD